MAPVREVCSCVRHPEQSHRFISVDLSEIFAHLCCESSQSKLPLCDPPNLLWERFLGASAWTTEAENKIFLRLDVSCSTGVWNGSCSVAECKALVMDLFYLLCHLQYVCMFTCTDHLFVYTLYILHPFTVQTFHLTAESHRLPRRPPARSSLLVCHLVDTHETLSLWHIFARSFFLLLVLKPTAEAACIRLQMLESHL